MRRYAGGKLSLDVQHDLRTEMLGALSRLDGARQDEIHTGQLVSRSISDINMIQWLLSFLPDHDRQRAALRRVDRHHAVPVAAADPGGARGRAGAVGDRAPVPAQALPGELARPAAGRRGRRDRRRERRRRPRGQGLRAGRPGTGADGGREHGPVRLPGPARAPDGPVQPRAAGRPHPRPGRGAGPRRLAGDPGLHQPRNVPGLLHLPRHDVRPGPDAHRPGHHRAGGAGQRHPGAGGHRLPPRDHRQARRGTAARRRGRDRVRRRAFRLRAVRAGAARALAARRPG